MSMTRCDSCSGLIDSDEDVECYYHTEGKCLCEWCRDEMDLQAENRKKEILT